MTPTSDERIEIAEKLRGIAHRHDAVKCGSVTNILGLEYGIYGSVVAFPSDAVSRLADLIDPTCHLVGTTSEEGLFDGLTIFSHELSCGHTCETVWLEPPAYCDVCGARVVDDDQR